MSRLYHITNEEVAAAWEMTRRAGGGDGYDRQSIKDVKTDATKQLYKIWNRMSSGSYIPDPVLLVNIPKANGGVRQLGIPTVTDRIAQNVIKNRLEQLVQPHFHTDSYAYQAGKGAIEALSATRERCFQHDWLLELDIKAYFDELDHDLLQAMVEKYVTDPLTLLYVKKFLKAPGITADGEKIQREKGTPQGGVVSPVLANLFLHEAFDSWMAENFPNIEWARYADDIVVHCVSEKQAHFMKARIDGRMKQFKLTLHPEKTKIVYTGRGNNQDHRGHAVPRKFTFLGYDFKPRYYKGRTVFTPGISRGALKRIHTVIEQKWCLRKRTAESLGDIAASVNLMIKGWIGYYGHFRRSELYKLAAIIDRQLVSFIKRKYKKRSTWSKAWVELKERKLQEPKLFCHWHMISPSVGGAV